MSAHIDQRGAGWAKAGWWLAAVGMTAVAVRCSAWLGVAFDSEWTREKELPLLICLIPFWIILGVSVWEVVSKAIDGPEVHVRAPLTTTQSATQPRPAPSTAGK